jgi:hypothetical protein
MFLDQAMGCPGLIKARGNPRLPGARRAHE